MNVLPLQDIRLDFASHRSVLWWTVLLYRAPRQVRSAEKDLMWRQRAAIVGLFDLHWLPYVFLLGALGRWLIFAVLDLPASPALMQSIEIYGPFWGHIVNLAIGLAFGLAGGFAIGFTFGLAAGLAVGLSFVLAGGLAGGLAFGLAGGLAGGLAFGLAVGLVFGLAAGLPLGLGFGLAAGPGFGLAVGFGFGLGGDLAGGLQIGIAAGTGWILGFLPFYFRLYYLPAHLCFLWPRARPKVYRWHPLAWDEACPLPFPGLDRLLVAWPCPGIADTSISP